jgi:TRAP-type C4-dicarboxylate transport system permease small subunit
LKEGKKELMLGFIKKVSDFINAIAEKIALLLVIALTVLTTIGVIYRYLLHQPLVWLYETSVVTFVWMIFLGVSIAFKRREHIKLNFLIDAVPPIISKLLKIIIELITITFMVFVVVQGAQIVQNTSAQTYNTINLSIAWFYASFPVCAIFMIIHLLESVMVLIVNNKE